MHLVTTRLGAQDAAADGVLLLGSWCRTYASKSFPGKEPSLLPYHWDDRDKLARDYAYLQGLHSRILATLSNDLNELHGIQRDRRYWRTLLDPWLFDYLGAMFDRWESIEQVFQAHPSVTTDELVPPSATRAPRDWPDFIDLATGDDWNHRVYLDILQRNYASHCEIRRRPLAETVPSVAARSQTAASSERYTVVKKLKRIVGDVWLWAEKLVCDRNAVFFYNTHMPAWALFELNVRLGQWPRFRSCFALPGDPLAAASAVGLDERRRTFCNSIAPPSPFEDWLFARLGSDVPVACVEAFDLLRQRADEVTARCKVIFTSNAHFTEAPFKAWCAEKVHGGCVLAVSEHGGSFPPADELFDFEESISDARVSWFRPYDSKHVQLPATKLLGHIRPIDQRIRLDARGGLCAAIAADYPRYAYRAHYYPIAGQVEIVHQMIIELRDRLGPGARDAFRVKPYPALDAYRDTFQWFIQKLGAGNVITGRSLKEVFAASSLVVCMYPETTFSEAMACGVPVVLLYPPHIYERHTVAHPLLDALKQTNILFYDAAAAAAHIDSVWENPAAWWQREDVIAVRQRFHKEALGYDGRSLTPWLAFFRDMIARADGVSVSSL